MTPSENGMRQGCIEGLGAVGKNEFESGGAVEPGSIANDCNKVTLSLTCEAQAELNEEGAENWKFQRQMSLPKLLIVRPTH
jgi:hypothetical protein